MTKIFKSSADMTLDDLKPIFDFFLSRSVLNHTGKKPICVNSKKDLSEGKSSPNFAFVMELRDCFPESSIKELVDFAIEEHHEGNSVIVTCSDNQAGVKACKNFNNEVATRQSNLIGEQSSDAEL